MTQQQEYDLVIIGGGPAALSAAIYAGRGELNSVILERQGIGGQVALTHAIDNYPGFPEGISGPDLVERMTEQAKRFNVEMRMEEVLKVERQDPWKIVTTSEGHYRTLAVILATGSDPRKLNVPGEEELRGRGVSYCGTCDAPFFREKRVVVVGGGDTALKEALFIAKFAREVIVVHRRREFRAERIYQTEASHNPRIRFQLDSVVEHIVGEEHVKGVDVRNIVTMASESIPCDGVFIFIGTAPNTHFLGNLFLTEHGGNIGTDLDMMTSVPGFYAVGDVRKYSCRQVATAVGEGATAAIAAEHWIAARKAEMRHA